MANADSKAAADDPTPVSPARGGQRALTLSVLRLGVITLGGLAWIISTTIGASDLEPHRILRLASAQYVDGKPIVAGDLAERAELPDPISESGDDDSEAAPDAPIDPADAEMLGDEASEQDDVEASWRSLRYFLIGAGRYAKADLLPSPRDRSEAMTQVIEPLRRSEALGFPDGRHAEAYRLLGLAYFELGQFVTAEQYLTQAMNSDLTLRTELLPRLAKAQAENNPIGESPEAALGTINEYLLDSALRDSKRAEAQKLKIELLIQASRYDDAQDLIEQTRELIQPAIREQAPWAISVEDHLKLHWSRQTIKRVIDSFDLPAGVQRIAGIPINRMNEIDSSYQRDLQIAITSLTRLRREAPPAIAAQTRLLAAQCHLLLEQENQALALMTQLRQQRPFRKSGLEGGISELELLSHAGRGADAVQTANFLIREVTQSRYLTLSDVERQALRDRVIESLNQLRDNGNAESAVALSRAAGPLLTPAIAMRQQGISYLVWAENALAGSRGADDDMSESDSALARARFRGAGEALSDAADLLFTTEDYLPTLWEAVVAFQRGRHFGRSIDLLQPYLRYEDRTRQSRGLVAHGRALLAQGEPERAIDSLVTCIVEFPRDPLRYDARLLASQAAIELGQSDQAMTWLRANLTDGRLAPQSPAWRDALHTLGDLLYSQAEAVAFEAQDKPTQERVDLLKEVEPKLTEANRRLWEAKERYWPSLMAQRAAYQLAQTERLLAQLPETEIELPGLANSVRRELRATANTRRQKALDRFTDLIDYLDERRLESELHPRQAALLRNCLVAKADVLAEMDRIGEAADTYRDLAFRYMNEPPCLEGLLGQSRMIRQLGRDREADLLIRQAAQIFRRIGPQYDDQFASMTRYDRREWQKYLDWMTDQLDQGES
ncbi:MAG: hypothetical protein AAF745_07485 [Planctomycetota bacterium]